MGSWICKCGKECDGNFCASCGNRRPDDVEIKDAIGVDKEISEIKIPDENTFWCNFCGARNTSNPTEKTVKCCKCGESITYDLEYHKAVMPTVSRLNIENLPDLQKGSEFIFGRYGRWQMKWIVIDKAEGRIEAIAQAGFNLFLDKLAYNETLRPTTWNTSSLRRYLNEEFIYAIFSEEERNRIISTDVPSDNNSVFGTRGGDSTVDKVFILSEDEACRLITEDYVRKNKWWLRTPGYNNTAATFFENDVDLIGEQVNKGKKMEEPCTRPVIWINTSDIARFTRDVSSEEKPACQKGDEIEFGFDPHTGPIKWKVLDIKDNKALIITNGVFREMIFDDKKENEYPMWENCSLRIWLNDSFIKSYFLDEEKDRIQITNNSNSSIKKYDDSIIEAHNTNDRVFLLSAEEAAEYFNSDEERSCEKCSWRLRTATTYSVQNVEYTGKISDAGLSADWYDGIRPAMWISI